MTMFRDLMIGMERTSDFVLYGARPPSLQPLAWHRLLHCKRASNPPRRPSLRLPGGGGGDGGDGGSPLFKPDKGAAS